MNERAASKLAALSPVSITAFLQGKFPRTALRTAGEGAERSEAGEALADVESGAAAPGEEAVVFEAGFAVAQWGAG